MSAALWPRRPPRPRGRAMRTAPWRCSTRRWSPVVGPGAVHGRPDGPRGHALPSARRRGASGRPSLAGCHGLLRAGALHDVRRCAAGERRGRSRLRARATRSRAPADRCSSWPTPGVPRRLRVVSGILQDGRGPARRSSRPASPRSGRDGARRGCRPGSTRRVRRSSFAILSPRRGVRVVDGAALEKRCAKAPRVRIPPSPPSPFDSDTIRPRAASRPRRGRLVAEGAALEMRYGATHRGFESLPLRHLLAPRVPVAAPMRARAESPCAGSTASVTEVPATISSIVRFHEWRLNAHALSRWQLGRGRCPADRRAGAACERGSGALRGQAHPPPPSRHRVSAES